MLVRDEDDKVISLFGNFRRPIGTAAVQRYFIQVGECIFAPPSTSSIYAKAKLNKPTDRQSTGI